MSDIAQKWDQKYAQINPAEPVPPCWVLQHHSKHLPLNGKALDLACGLGGNARFMAMCGLKVDAWDISDIALTHLNNWAAVHQLPIFVTIADLEQMLFPFQQYDVITVSQFLNRDLMTQIDQALKPGGKLFYQTFLGPVQDNAPNNPNFYLQPGELNQLFSNKMNTLVYGEGWLNHRSDSNHKNRYAWLVAEKR